MESLTATVAIVAIRLITAALVARAPTVFAQSQIMILPYLRPAQSLLT